MKELKHKGQFLMEYLLINVFQISEKLMKMPKINPKIPVSEKS